MIESIYRLRCDQCRCFGPQDATQQRVFEVAGQINWSADPASGDCLCAYCRPDGYAKGVVDGREAERGRCLMLIDQLLEKTKDCYDCNGRNDLITLKNSVLLGLRKLPEQD